MPIIRKVDIALDNVELIGYDKISNHETHKIVHFFLDDYKFEVLWNNPAPRIEKLKEYRAVLAPQYSVYSEMPMALQIFQVFKSRWCGAFLQQKGIKVIPSLVWGEPDTFWFCFDGIEAESIVAVSTVGMRTEKQLFMAGYNEMMRRIKPRSVICYGEPFDEMEGNLIIIDYAQTNNLQKSAHANHSYIKYLSASIEKGGGAAGDNTGNASQRSIPEFPGWDPSQSPSPEYQWRGRGEPGSKTGNWFNPTTREWLRPDIDHPAPIGAHWDYGIRGETTSYRIFPDGSFEIKKSMLEGAIYT